MKHIKFSIICLLAVSLLFSLSATAFADTCGEHSPFDVNENGESYGDYFQAMEAGVDPDLIAAQGVDGTRGYVRASDLEEPMPESPDAALALQAERRASGYAGRYINLYASDGLTVIGSFFISMPDFTPDTSARSEVMYSSPNTLTLPDCTATGWSAIQQVIGGVKFYSIVQTNQVVSAGRVASRSMLYNEDTGDLVKSTSYDYNDSSGTYFPHSATYFTTSGNYYCRGLGKVMHPDGVWGTMSLGMTPICDAD